MIVENTEHRNKNNNSTGYTLTSKYGTAKGTLEENILTEGVRPITIRVWDILARNNMFFY